MFGEKLKKLRTDAGLTQEELAEKIFVTRAAISKWETGRGYPNIDSLKQLAVLFGVTLDQLIGDADVENHNQIEQRRSRRFYWYAMACLVLTLLATLGTIFLLPQLSVLTVVGVIGYVAFALLSKQKDKPFTLRKYIVPYVVSRVIVFIIVLAAAAALLSMAV